MINKILHSDENILVGDIGGTNTRLMYLSSDDQQETKIYPSGDYPNLNAIIALFIKEYQILSIDSACFAVAGPIHGDSAKVTNLPWDLNSEQLSQEFNIARVKLINDFTAVGFGIESLSDEYILTIQEGSSIIKPYPSSAILGAGTGLGVARRVWINEEYHLLSSETGHTSFAPNNEIQLQLLAWLLKQNEHVSLESVLSGSGLVRIYEFMQYQYADDKKLIEQSIKINLASDDAAQEISENALGLEVNQKDDLCIRALNCFMDIYAATVGNVVLQCYPVDEVYIAGGIAAKIHDKFLSQRFKQVFSNKGLMSSNLEKVKIKLITDELVGLEGAFNYLKNR